MLLNLDPMVKIPYLRSSGPLLRALYGPYMIPIQGGLTMAQMVM